MEALLAKVPSTPAASSAPLIKCTSHLMQVCPDGDFSAELGGRFDKETWLRDKGTRPSLPATKDPSPAAIPFVSPAGLGESSDDALYPASDNEHDELCGSLSERLKRLKVDPISTRFIGKSSGAGIVLSAIALKKEFVGGPVLEQFERNMIARRPEFWCMAPVRTILLFY